MPGVVVTTALSPGAAPTAGDPAGRAFLIGLTERGPASTPTQIVSLGQFEQVFGPRTSYSSILYDQVRTFFNEGGSEVWILRVVGVDAAPAALTLLDRAAGTPLPTVKISAINPGAYGAELSVQVAAGTVTNTVTITVSRSGSVVEVFRNLLGPVAVVEALAGSKWVRGTNMNSATAAPGNLPAVLAATALTGGDDDRDAVSSATLVAALPLFGRSYGSGAIAIPGHTWDQVGAGLIAHAKANRRIAILFDDVDADTATLVTAAASLGADGRFGGLFGPWVKIPDGSASRTIDPSGYVLGVRARAMANEGFWRGAAGAISEAQFVVGTAWPLSEDGNNTLYAAGVNGIVTYPRTVELMGWKSLDLDVANYGLLSAADTINSIAGRIEEVLHQFVHRPIDGRKTIYGEVDGAIRGVLQPIADAGGLYARYRDDGTMVDPGYSVVVDDSVNPADQLGSNSLAAAVGLRLSPTAVELLVTIHKTPLNAAL